MRRIFFMPLVLAFLLAITVSCEKKEPPQRPPVDVSIEIVEPKTLPAEFEYIAVVESSHLVDIFARVQGYLDKIAYVEGEVVKAGDLLFQLDPKQFVASLDSAKADLAKQEAVLWDATRARERLEPLYKQKAASQRDLDNAIAQELAQKALVEASKANVVQAELNLSYTSITSPITGLTGQSKYRVGTLITPGVNGLLTTVSILDPIWVVFYVSENDILKSREQELKGQLIFPKDMNFNVQFVLANGVIMPSKGVINFADPSYQQSTGTMRIRAIVENPNTVLRPGQFVRARLLGATRPNAIAVPQTAVLQGSKSMYVYVVNKDNVVETRDVVPGDWWQNYWIIDQGLVKGDKVLVDGTNRVQAGSKVTIKNVQAAPSEQNINNQNTSQQEQAG